MKVIETTVFRGVKGAQIEDLFSHLEIVAPALALAGVLIIVAGVLTRHDPNGSPTKTSGVNARQSALIGAVVSVSRSEDSRALERLFQWACWWVFQSPVLKRSALLSPSCLHLRWSLAR